MQIIILFIYYHNKNDDIEGVTLQFSVFSSNRDSFAERAVGRPNLTPLLLRALRTRVSERAIKKIRELISIIIHCVSVDAVPRAAIMQQERTKNAKN